jgi:hypothetical protein
VSTRIELFLLLTLRLLVEGLGVGGSASDVGVTGGLVRAGGELELVGGLQVGIAGGAVGGSVVTEVEEESEHLEKGRMLESRIHSADN